MSSTFFARTLPLIALAILMLSGPIACNKSDEFEETVADLETTGDPAGEATADPAPPVALSPEEIPDVVARLNDTDISKDELLTFAQGLQQRLTQSGINPGPMTAEFYRSALDQLMGASLLYDNAVALGKGATDDEVTAQLNMMKSRFPSPEEFTEALASQNFTEEMMVKDIERGISVQNLIDQEIFPQISIAEGAERTYYDANLDQMQQPEQISVRHILVRVDENSTEVARVEARTKADSLLTQALGGEDFNALAQANSDDPGSAQRGGDLGWVARGQTVPQFEQAAFGLQKSQLSGVVESPFGFHIIKLEDRKAAATMPFEDVSEGIRQMLLRQEMEGAVDSRITSLREEADVEIFI